MRQQQQGISNELLQYAHSVPGSSPDELANYAQSRAQAGEGERALQQRVFASYNPNQGIPAAQLLANLGNANIAREMAQRSAFLQDAAANRRQALLNAANLGQGAASLYRPIQPQFPQVAGQLAQMLAYQQAQRQAQQQNGDVNTLQQQGGGLNAWYNQSRGAAPAAPPAGWADPGIFAGMSPETLAALQQTGWGMHNPNGTAGSLTPGAPPLLNLPGMIQGLGMQGAGAPGNQLGGMNGLNNQIRQSMGLDRTLDLGGGLRLRF